jgi:hypothetical protein
VFSQETKRAGAWKKKAPNFYTVTTRSCGCEPSVWREINVFAEAEEREQQKEYPIIDPKKRRVRMVAWATQQLHHKGLLLEDHANGVPLSVIQGIGKLTKVPRCLEQGIIIT